MADVRVEPVYTPPPANALRYGDVVTWVWRCTCHGLKSKPWPDRPTPENAEAEHDLAVAVRARRARSKRAT